MNKNLSYYIRRYLDYYLKSVRNFSDNTILSYRDTIKLFLKYILDIKKYKINEINFEILNKENINDFLNYLENNRNYNINSRNQRLHCLKSFCNFLIDEDASNLSFVQNVLSIKPKKFPHKEIKYLSKEEMNKLLLKPNTKTINGIKELLILTLLYDAGLRVSELINLKVKDIMLDGKIAKIQVLMSKNNKSREIPITDNTKSILLQYINHSYLQNNDYLILSNRKNKYTSNGIRKIIKKYTSDIDFKVTPHTFRHTKASHLVETNVPIIYIRDFLGHESIDTTMIYAKINGKIKNETIINNSLNLDNQKINYKLNDSELIQWLESL